MISISNADRDKVVEILQAYASLIKENGMRTIKQTNARSMALRLAKKLGRKHEFPMGSKILRKQRRYLK